MISGTVVPTHFSCRPCHFPVNTPSWEEALRVGFSRARASPSSSSFSPFRLIKRSHRHHLRKSDTSSAVIARVSGDGGGAPNASQKQSESPDIEEENSTSSSSADGYVALFVRMLGLDQDPLDREQAVVALWKYSLGGKKYIDSIMQFHGCINLIVNLLKSKSGSTCEAAAGLLRSISSVNIYREKVADAGAIEEITALLARPSLPSEVKEQSLCTLWNLSVDEKFRLQIASPDVLPIIIDLLDDEDLKVKEAAGGVMSTLALSQSNHNTMVELGAILKLAAVLRTNEEGWKVIRKEARNALLELAKNDYYRILIIEEGLMPVPMVGSAAYKSFKPSLHSWPSLPDGTEIEQTFKEPSRFGASELLLGLNISENDANIEEAKMNALIGRTQQQFLARIGAIELDDEKKTQLEASSKTGLTLLPCTDGVARLVLILGLDDEGAVSRAAEAIADSSINEFMRVSFKEAGAVKILVQLLERDNDAIRSSVTRALERLSLSVSVCQAVEAEGVIYHLVKILKEKEIPESLTEKTLNILARILNPSKEMKLKFYRGPVNKSNRGSEAGGETYYSNRKEVFDSSVISRLVEIMKSSNLNLRRKAASILEFATTIDSCMDMIISADIESGLTAVFQQTNLDDTESDADLEEPEKYALEVEEMGLTVSAASRLLTKLLDSASFCQRLNFTHLTTLLRKTLRSSIPVTCKDWVAACLVKLISLSGTTKGLEEDLISTEVTLYETIPRLIQQLESSTSEEAREGAVVELNRIVSKGVAGSTRAIASQGGIFHLVKLLGEGPSERASQAALAVLYSLSMDAENHEAIVAAGAVPILRRIVLAERPEWTRALRLLRNLPV
ncbi:uncharacterized protein LOC116200839 isoform X2 [Punica granatum]|uniref:Uncharacterized protein LOC116200839 isoform X2 n=2 Tax=Punica granatum TaxID=22663 RepID=A0A6P8CUR8_PUNGR|nr:uncharacterized protein LOC116200839 isoform X2 [Punica granatum]